MTTAPILVVDDDASITEVITAILELEGYTVTAAANGAEALRAVEQTRPSLVLLDMRMPVMDGWQFAQALKDRGVGLPIVVMTAAQNARRWADEVGAVAYLSKPFELADLLDTVEHLVEKPAS